MLEGRGVSGTAAGSVADGVLEEIGTLILVAVAVRVVVGVGVAVRVTSGVAVLHQGVVVISEVGGAG